MQVIKPSQIFTFMAFLTLSLLGGIGTTNVLLGRLSLGDFRGITWVTSTIVFSYCYAVALYRLFLRVMPLREGEIAEGSQQAFVYHVYILFYLILFYPIMRSGVVPAPLMRQFYLALGTRLGANTYSQGIILDPPFIEVGDNSVIGQNALLVPHIIEGRRLAHYPIRVGNNVTIGAHAVVLSDVRIGDNAVVATGAIVKKGTRIGAGEVWGGVPARLLERLESGY